MRVETPHCYTAAPAVRIVISKFITSISFFASGPSISCKEGEACHMLASIVRLISSWFANTPLTSSLV